ncbi:MAG: hypothetical protein K6G88_00860 [Lachnospiraceae bacterium]|nr:hypothetical protein [Lachnospiraceae bacterium]
MKKVKKIVSVVLIITAAIIAIPVLAWNVNKAVLTRDGFIGEEQVKIASVDYRYDNFVVSKEGKTIALVDDWKINEVPEDPSHTFLVVRSFLDQYYIVKRDYVIPVSGDVSCAYIDGERTTDDELLTALTQIMNTKFEDGKEIEISYRGGDLEKYNFKSVIVGYGDCPVGTDSSIYYIGKKESNWIIIFRDELSEEDGDKQSAIYYELDEKYSKTLEKSEFSQ